MTDNNQPASSREEMTDEADFDQSDALRKAIAKLKAQGKIIVPPDDLAVSSADSITEVPPEVAKSSEATAGDTGDAVAESASAVETDEVVATTAEDSAVDAKTAEPDAPATRAATEMKAATDEWELPQEADEADRNETAITPQDAAALLEAGDGAQAISTTEKTPWTLQQFFDGEIDLDVELSKRFPNMPLMSAVKFRNLGNKTTRRVATLQTQDGSASLVVDADIETKSIQLSFTYGSMMTLRYSLADLSDADRARWLELMRRERGGLSFLWGPSRWQNDYLICIGRKYFTNVYAFSPNSFESAVRVTPQAMTELLDWLDDIWTRDAPDSAEDDDAPLLTW